MMFDLQNAAGVPIYVHAKVCIVDDEWMTIGSDNLNLRSWTHDSELTCAIVDPDGELPRSLRTTLWAEHLGLPEDDPRLAGPATRRPSGWSASVLRAAACTSMSRCGSRRAPPAGRHRSTAASSTPTGGRADCAGRRSSRTLGRRGR